ncbi:MAG: hypothetical protein ACOCXJ_04660 [Planctomycetota bacterium]
MRLVPPLLLLLLCTTSLPAAEEIWIHVDFHDRAQESLVYFCGRTTESAVADLQSGRSPFIELRSTCWIEYDENERPIGVGDFADWKDSDRILINADLIEKVVVLRGDPRLLIDKYADSMP